MRLFNNYLSKYCGSISPHGESCTNLRRNHLAGHTSATGDWWWWGNAYQDDFLTDAEIQLIEERDMLRAVRHEIVRQFWR